MKQAHPPAIKCRHELVGNHEMEDLAVVASAIAGEKTVSRARDLFRDHYLRISSEGAEQLSELVGCGEVADAKGSTNWDQIQYTTILVAFGL